MKEKWLEGDERCFAEYKPIPGPSLLNLIPEKREGKTPLKMLASPLY